MDLKEFITPIIKWWWLILATFFLALVTSYYFTQHQPLIYTASTKLVIGQIITNPNPSGNDFFVNQQLTGFYANLISDEPVRLATMKTLGLNWLPNYAVKLMGNNQFLEIDVSDTSPQRAQAVAQELARQLILLSPSSGQNGDQTRQSFTQGQINDIQNQIDQTNNQITTLQSTLGSLQSAQAISQAQQDLVALQTKLSILQTNYANLVASSQLNISNSIQVLEPASLPIQPVGPSKYIIIILAGVIGLFLGSGASYLLEYIDDTIKTPADIQQLLNVPAIGFLADMGKKFDNEGPYVYNHPRSKLAEAYRTLRVSLEFPKTGKALKTILVTSPDAGDGKTTVAINLALTMLQTGKRVLLVDSDMRRPTVHKYLQIGIRPGLSDWLQNKAKLDESMIKWQDTELQVLTAGTMVDDLLDQTLTPQKIVSFMSVLQSWADYVIIDCPPLLVSNTMMIAAKADGTILVVRPGRTHKEMAQVLMERINWAGVNVVGAVLNRIPLSQVGFIGNYRYFSPYYYSGYFDKDNNKSNGKTKTHLKELEKEDPATPRAHKN